MPTLVAWPLLTWALAHARTAWDIESGVRDTIKISKPIACAKTQGKRVGILLIDGQALVWKFRGPVLAIITQNPLPHCGSSTIEKAPSDLILHPLHPDVTYVTWLGLASDEEPSTSPAVYVQTYVGSECKGVLRQNLEGLSTGTGELDEELLSGEECAKFDAYGGYTVLTMQETAGHRKKLIQCPAVGHSRPWATQLHVAFNIYSRCFSTSVYHGMCESPGEWLIMPQCRWNRQCTLWFPEKYQLQTGRELTYDLPIMTVGECRGEPAASDETPLLYTKTLLEQPGLPKFYSDHTNLGPRRRVPLFKIIQSDDAEGLEALGELGLCPTHRRSL